MIFFTEELAHNLSAIEGKVSRQEPLTDDDLKMLLLNLLQIEDSHENE